MSGPARCRWCCGKKGARHYLSAEGNNSYTSTGTCAFREWVADLPADTAVLLGIDADRRPSEAMIHRSLQALDADLLAAAIGTWLATRFACHSPDPDAMAVDGETLRGRVPATAPARHVLAAADQCTGAVRASTDVDHVACLAAYRILTVKGNQGQPASTTGWPAMAARAHRRPEHRPRSRPPIFDNVNHLQSSWLTTGKDVGQLSLHMGVDDLGSIMLEENVISSAGARHRSKLTELVWMIRSADRIPAQRDTLYRRMTVHWTPADDPTDERIVSHFSSIAMPGGGAGGRTALPVTVK